MSNLAERIEELARRVKVNLPSNSNPEQFHVEKSEIEHELQRIARRLKEGKHGR